MISKDMETFVQQKPNMKLVGETYEGSLFMNDEYVIKVFNTRTLEESDLKNALEKAVEFSEKIPKYVPKVYSVYKLPGEIAITMEKIHGQTFYQYINSLKTRDYSPDEILKVVLSLCGAKSALHNLGYVHGDLNDTNVLVDQNLDIKLIDFTQADIITAVDPGDGITLKIYNEFIMISAKIAQLIFQKKHPSILNKNISQTIKEISNYTVDDVVGDGEIANKLFNILNFYRPSWVYLM